MIVINNNLSAKESVWVEAMLSDDISHKQQLLVQINNAEISREYTKYYLSIKFKVHKEIPSIEFQARVPVEMRLYKTGTVPIQLLLHVTEGYVSELEIFNADSSEINSAFDIANYKIELVI